jgi:copper chaperone CopZ
MTIKRELGELAGVTGVSGDVDSKMVTVEWESPATWDGIQSLLAEINYPPAEATG